MSEKSNSVSEREQEIQKFWEENKIFEKTLEATKSGPVFNFYDGPPFATGTTHYGHLVASVMKDVVPRYWTMKGYYVERRWGWDCHGLPIENIAEKGLGFKSKKDIEEYGIEKFNAYCRSKVLQYVEVWKKTIGRFGRWADMENAYKTMDLEYMESVWWVFKELYDRGLIYEGYKSMHVCPRCETTLSQQEVSEGYKDIKDLSVTAKFELVSEPLPGLLFERGGEKTFVLAWTTTPWTLPANVALAVGEDVEYVIVEKKDEKTDALVRFIVAKNLVEKFFAGQEYVIAKEFKGSELVGKRYKPLFPYYENEEAKSKIKNAENLYSIVTADFVTTEDGTGVVHIAPAFGEDDMNLGKEKNLPMIQNVTMGGLFTDEVSDFKGLNVKPADDTQKTDVEIIKYLAEKNLLFAKEKYEHSYPHCWRCDTPLINYATSSWFVKVTDVKPKAIKYAKDINWSPEHIKEGRFGKWLEGARDWSISRQRFWASVMPIWKCACGHQEVLGSIEDLRMKSEKKITKITFVRHGESEKNLLNINTCGYDSYGLTKEGKKQVTAMAKNLKGEKFDLILASPTKRTQESAKILGDNLKLDITVEELADEYNWGDWNGWERKKWEGYNDLSQKEKFVFKFAGNGESRADVVERARNLLKKIISEYSGKNILLVSHGGINSAIHKALTDCDLDEYCVWEGIDYMKTSNFYLMENGKVLDLHKDVIDDFYLTCPKCEGKMSRIPDVLDTWFDSGSMPYAQQHYPFENKEKFDASFPAQFIAEGVDQTRAWFYYLHVIASAIKDNRAFTNVIANGIVLAEDGKKMSKRLQNYPEPEIVMDKYGADALRYYLLSSPVMSAENMNFSEAGVKESLQKIVMLIGNILNFYKMYETENISVEKLSPKNILDKWLFAKLNALIAEVTKNMESYDLPRSVRPIQDFIDEFSTWWLRRSRDRLKLGSESEKKEALAVFKFTLIELSKIMAPFVPFISEYLYKQICSQKESVHLESWPKAGKTDDEILLQMENVRKIVEMGLAARSENGIKIRQPLASLKFPNANFKFKENEAMYFDLIKEEVNVKEVTASEGDKVELDLVLTQELKLEGMVRELIRTINEIRKQQGLSINDKVKVYWQSSSEVINKTISSAKYNEELKKNTICEEFVQQETEAPEVKLNGENIKIVVKKI